MMVNSGNRPRYYHLLYENVFFFWKKTKNLVLKSIWSRLQDAVFQSGHGIKYFECYFFYYWKSDPFDLWGFVVSEDKINHSKHILLTIRQHKTKWKMEWENEWKQQLQQQQPNIDGTKKLEARGAFSQSINRIDFDTYFRMKCTFIWVDRPKQAWMPGMTSGLVWRYSYSLPSIFPFFIIFHNKKKNTK